MWNNFAEITSLDPRIQNVLFSILHLSCSWNLPPAQFLTQFAVENDRSAVTLLMPKGMNEKLIDDHRKEYIIVIYGLKYNPDFWHC